jgi:hypothetical protein
MVVAAMDEKTNQYLINRAEERCTCANCTKEKALKHEQVEKAFKASLELPSKIVKPMSSNFVPELSSDNKVYDLGRWFRNRDEGKWLS